MNTDPTLQSDVNIQSVFNKSHKDKFRIILNLPKCLLEQDSKTQISNSTLNFDKLVFSVWGAIVPDQELNSTVIPYGGQNVSINNYTRKQYSNITINFNIDNRYTNYWVLSRWMDLINDSKTSSFDDSSISENEFPSMLPIYTTNFTIQSLDSYDNVVFEFNYIGAHPVKLSGFEFNHQNAGEEISTSAEFSFSQFIPSYPVVN